VIDAILKLSVRARWAIVLVVAVVAAVGAWQLTRLPIDATPDITNKQVQINTVAENLGPQEVEKRVTYPIETVLSGLDGVQSTRSFSRNGFSQVTVNFRENANLYFMRQQVSERLAQARPLLPPGVEPELGPVSTGLGEVLHYSVDFAEPHRLAAPGKPGWQADGSYLTDEGERLADTVSQLAYLRTVQDWIIRPQLRTTPGIADIDSLGGYVKQYLVEPDPVQMTARGVSYAELARALEGANLSVGANYIHRGGEAYLVRADARLRSMDDIAQAVVANRGGVPVRVRDLAQVRIGGELRAGAASKNGHEVVIGSALMLVGGNSRTVARAVHVRLDQIMSSLPPGIAVEVTLDRSQLVTSTIATVARNLGEGAILVVAVLFLVLGNWRAATIAALVIPLAMLISAIGMNGLKISGNLMSLGALDFGLIIDGAVIIVENSLRRLAERERREGRLLDLRERLEEVVASSREMVKPTVFGQIVIFLVFVPCLTFQGVEGKMFSPMVITLMLALASAFVLSLTFVPAMVAVLMTRHASEKEAPMVAWARRVYAPGLDWALHRPGRVVGGAVLLSAAALVVFLSLGREFMPRLDEQNLNLSSVRIPSTSIEQSVAIDKPLEKAVLSLPEVRTVYSKAGTASLAADPMPPNASDNYIILKPKKDWPAGVRTKDQVIERIRAKTAPLLGNAYDVTQPIEMRFNELIGGVRSDVAVNVYGDDLGRMGAAARAIAASLAKVRGVADLRVAQTRGFPTFDVKLDREAVSRYGLTMEDAAATLATAMGGREAGQLFRGDRRFDIVVRAPEAQRDDVEALGALPVMLPAEPGQPRRSVALRQLASFSFSDGLNEISRENGKRRIVVQANVRGRDLGSFVDEAQRRVAREVTLPPGSWLEWGGQFQNLREATARLSIVTPICFALILIVLYLALGDVWLAATVFSAVPLALAGGVFAIALRGIPFSVSSAVGFIALSGVAVLNGLVLMASIRRRFEAGEPLDQAIRLGALERLRPVLMTALVASLGFVPMAVATGAGAEVQKPLATVVIGGLITSTALTLFVLPAITRVVLARRTGRRGGPKMTERRGVRTPAAY
jgi:cobalt-zinc-cadmium resistance protein CzcA